MALVETVAHAESAMKFYDDPQVIVDVGGQDIKLIVLKNGRFKDFSSTPSVPQATAISCNRRASSN